MKTPALSWAGSVYERIVLNLRCASDRDTRPMYAPRPIVQFQPRHLGAHVRTARQTCPSPTVAPESISAELWIRFIERDQTLMGPR